jgi:diguanylate cyclase (GGDEF)-like protein
MSGLISLGCPEADGKDGAPERPTEGFLICTDDAVFVYASKGLDLLLRLAPGAADRQNDVFLLLADSALLDAPARAAIATRLEQARIARADCFFDVLSGLEDPLPITVQIQRVGDTHWIISFLDLGARQQAEDRVVTLTMMDGLTGLGNRLRFRQSLAKALSEAPVGAPKIALLLVDLDRFKAVNDTLGHPVGDELLRKVAGRLRTAIRQTDMLARLGGDEFAAWIPASDDSDVLARLAGRIIDLLGRPFLIEGMQVNIGASLGIAVAPQDGTTYEALMKTADLALYSAKASGRNIFHFFDTQMEERAQERRSLEIDLRRALALRQFELHYRPQIDVETGGLIALEAMLRWRHPERGVLEPASFMPIAEEIGLIPMIGTWILECGCSHAASWPDTVRLSVAISTPQFEAGSLVDHLKHALAASGLPAARLQIEITESVLLRNEAHVVRTLYELRASGVGIGISNFGTGYASLSKLDSFPFDRIRLDGSLVESQDASRRAIIGAVVAFGASLGVSTMVDGIRNGEQLAQIRAGGGPLVQGLLSINPMTALELERMLKGIEASSPDGLRTEGGRQSHAQRGS